MLEKRSEEAEKSIEKPQEDLTEYTGEADEYLSLDIDKFKSAFEQFFAAKEENLRKFRLTTGEVRKQRLTNRDKKWEILKEFF